MSHHLCLIVEPKDVINSCIYANNKYLSIGDDGDSFSREDDPLITSPHFIGSQDKRLKILDVS